MPKDPGLNQLNQSIIELMSVLLTDEATAHSTAKIQRFSAQWRETFILIHQNVATQPLFEQARTQKESDLCGVRS